jgi:hypothetical protein
MSSSSGISHVIYGSVGLAGVENGCWFLGGKKKEGRGRFAARELQRRGQNCAEEFLRVLAHWPVGDFAASACCSCMVTATVTITTPNIASADTMAITTNVVLLDISKS